MSGSTGLAGSHTHHYSDTTSSGGSHTHSIDDRWTGSTSSGSWLARGSASSDYRWGPTTRSINSGSGGSHSHSFSGYTDSDGSHSHTISASIGSAGDGQSFSILPPYTTAYCWKRIS